MAATRIRAEDVVGIGIAVAAHIALFAWLIFARSPELPPPPPKVTVTLQGPVAAEAGSPSREEAAAAQAPTLAEEPAPPAEVAPAPAPPQQSASRSEPPRPAPKALPTPTRPQPLPRAAAPAPVPQPRAQSRPVTPPARTPPPPPQQRQSRVGSDFLPARSSRVGKDFLPPASRRPGGASRIGNDFLPGAAAGNGKAATPPGAAITPELRMSFAQAVLRQVRPNWQGRVPQGLDAEKLVSIISVQLNRDGSIAGEPVLLRQEGINDANSSQARRHGEEAIRAVKLSAPFRLPPDAYEGWKKLPPLRFRKGS